MNNNKPAVRKNTAIARRDAFLYDRLEAVKSRATDYFDSGLVPEHWLKDKGGYFPKEKAVARLAIAFQAGQEAGLRSYQECLNYMYVVNNLPTIYGSGNNILIQRNPNFRGVVRNEWDDAKQMWILTVKVNSNGEINEVTTTFSAKQAKESGLTQRNQNYGKYMRQMAERKCWSRMYQIHFPGGIESYEHMDHTEEVQSEWEDMSGEYDSVVLDGKTKEELIDLALDNPENEEIQERIAQLDDIAEDVEVEEVQERPKVFERIENYINLAQKQKVSARKPVGFTYVTDDEVTYAESLEEKQDEIEAQKMFEHLVERFNLIKDYMRDDMLEVIVKGPDAPGLQTIDYATGEEVAFKAEA